MNRIFYLLIALMLFSTAGKAQDLTVGSYNIRLDIESDARQGDGWERRCGFIAQLVHFNDFDILGTQEVLHNQLEDMLEALPQYDYVGVARGDGKTEGEYSPVMYKRDRFEALQSGTFWLSEETDHPNIGWDAAYPRVCSWVELWDVEKEKQLWVFNLHMDHIGVEARRESAKLVMRKVEEMCGDDNVILMGDFNVDQTNESYKLLAESDMLSDSYEVADMSYALNGTFNAFNPKIMSNSRIDHIFVSNNFSVYRYGILTDSYRTPVQEGEEGKVAEFPDKIFREEAEIRLPSDHYPVKVTLYYR